MRPISIRTLIVVVVCALAAACTTPPQSGSGLPAPPPPAAPSPTDPPDTGGGPRTLDLGDWSRGEPAAIQNRFVRSLEAAARPGEPMNAALETMRQNGFGCSHSPTRNPAHVCERQFLQGGCTHTWQVLLIGDARLNEARGSYDRVCRDGAAPGGGLLGAPPG